MSFDAGASFDDGWRWDQALAAGLNPDELLVGTARGPGIRLASLDLLEHRISVAGSGDYADALTDLRHRLIAALIGPTDEEEGGEW